MSNYRRVLVGTDGSPTAEEAVRHAADLAACLAAELLIVTAFQAQPGATARAQQDAPEDLQWMITDSAVAEEHTQNAQRIARQAGVANVRVRAEDGDPARVLIDVANDAGADVIVVGSKGMASASRFVLGSVPNKVSHHAPCDVLIVHTVD
jgi:nucleotide-binding universal stress UspA family protein